MWSTLPCSDSETEEEGTVSPLRPRSPSGDIMVNPPIPRQPSITIERRVSTVNEAYIQFVQTLLKECKLKVRRTGLDLRYLLNLMLGIFIHSIHPVNYPSLQCVR